jgi:hypothetical protein
MKTLEHKLCLVRHKNGAIRLVVKSNDGKKLGVLLTIRDGKLIRPFSVDPKLGYKLNKKGQLLLEKMPDNGGPGISFLELLLGAIIKKNN